MPSTSTPADLAGAGDVPPPPRLPLALPRAGVSRDARAGLRQLLDDHARASTAAFRHGADARELAHARAHVVDMVCAHVWSAFVGETGAAALFAVGGFGHGLLFPYSDIDLLVLHDPEPGAPLMRGLEAFFACLWDVGLKPGQAVRSLAQCRELAAADVGVFTSLLDARRLAGAERFALALRALLDDPTLWPPDAYLAAKLEERAGRHARYDDTTHNLEPDLKDGPGGLRNLDLIRWLGKRLVGVDTLDGLVQAHLLEASERDALREARATLRRDRYALHLEAGRAEERLLFDWQRALAARLGHAHPDATGNDAVERFMQEYFRAAGTTERLLVQLLERLQEFLQPLPPPRDLDAHFVMRGSRLELRDPDWLSQAPEGLVEVFVKRFDVAGCTGVTAATMRAVEHALVEHGSGLSRDPAVLAAFLALLRRGAGAVRVLEALNRHGVLAAILPPFARVVGRMQYDLFHVYTVDEHTLRVLRNIARYAEPETRAALPLACEAFARLAKPELLLLAALFHDIAKGRGGDHSQLGESEARAFCRDLGLGDDDIDEVAWLVRWHLLMSETAQRQDIADQEVVHRFAVQVGDWSRLDMLYLLTIADIAGTSPKLWNSWKDRLLADLYVAARYVLRRDLERPARAEVRVREARERALTLLAGQGLDALRAATLLDTFPDVALLRQHPGTLAWQVAAMLDAGDSASVVAVRPPDVRGGTELFVATPDRDGVFAAVVATLDRLRLDVVAARVMTSRDGRALDTFTVLEAGTQAPVPAGRMDEVRDALLRVLAAPALRTQPAQRNLTRRLRHFQRPPRIDFHGGNGQPVTRLALVCSDRPGLLVAIAQAFLDVGVRVHDARIATFGDQVEDFFELSDRHDAAIDAGLQERLRGALQRRLAPGSMVATPE
ncbi:MAG: [protein-PII] uridylyltransferase [Xanthomonadales bacterium]|nr:[protein-PII] uridylyltransferase [Xanthomonadales bacterium]ODU92788.1 MAG: [protein-PII] uridylyltransferase [Rhodanobacter sp. SCN 66-43]OJY83846.1 MAG: [protein-PII] uridylyltransferase [Xanthomonadales bacterium 66-474]